jgi:hypothetical protein
MRDKLELSLELEKFRDKIESSLKPFIANSAEKNNKYFHGKETPVS